MENNRTTDEINDELGAVYENETTLTQMKHSALMTEWRNKYPKKAFNNDGIVDFLIWEKQDNKVLILLKEAHHSESIIKDIRENKPFHNIWITVARYIKALEITKSEYLPTLEDVDKYDHNILHRIAIVNINKVDGESYSDYNKLKLIADENSELIKRQIEIINPNIIICGGTKEFFDTIFWENIGFDKFSVPQTDNVIFKSKKCILFDITHPSYRVSNLMKHYSFAGVYQKYLQQTNSKP